MHQVDIMDSKSGRPTGGKLEVKVRTRQPIEGKDIDQREVSVVPCANQRFGRAWR